MKPVGDPRGTINYPIGTCLPINATKSLQSLLAPLELILK